MHKVFEWIKRKRKKNSGGWASGRGEAMSAFEIESPRLWDSMKKGPFYEDPVSKDCHAEDEWSFNFLLSPTFFFCKRHNRLMLYHFLWLNIGITKTDSFCDWSIATREQSGLGSHYLPSHPLNKWSGINWNSQTLSASRQITTKNLFLAHQGGRRLKPLSLSGVAPAYKTTL